MTRTLSTAVASAVTEQTGAAVHLLRLSFGSAAGASSNLYLTDAPSNLAATVVSSATETATFVALGGTLAFDTAAEGPMVGMGGLGLTLQAVSSEVMALLLANYTVGRMAYLWRAHLDADYAVRGTPVLLFAGYQHDAWLVRDLRSRGRPTSLIQTRLADPTAVLDQRRGFQTTPESHQAVYAGDTFFKFTPVLAYRALYWGSVTMYLKGMGFRSMATGR